MIQNNPFLSDTFTKIWSKHFASDADIRDFDFIPSLKFTEHKSLPLFTNVGQTFTKGIDYSLHAQNTESFKNKTFLIYDVPGYFDIDTETNAALGIYRSTQYPGFLIELEKFNDLNAYMAASFSKSSRYKLKKYKKRFEASFDVRYVMYRGEMERETYDTVFEYFKVLLEKRFDDKQVTNNNLDPKEWQFYHEVTYPMLLEGKASLFVIYNGQTPVGVTLNFLSDDILFDAITVFDIDYCKFHLGSITIMALLEWCLENKLRIFDFSKGFFDYKTRWSTMAYDFEYHIYYDTKSLRASTTALFLKKFFDFKQQLRQKNINEKLHRLTYRFKNTPSKPEQLKNFTFTEIADDVLLDGLDKLAIDGLENHNLRLLVFEYLYLNDAHYSDIEVYAVPDTPNHFYVMTKTKKILATLD